MNGARPISLIEALREAISLPECDDNMRVLLCAFIAGTVTEAQNGTARSMFLRGGRFDIEEMDAPTRVIAWALCAALLNGEDRLHSADFALALVQSALDEIAADAGRVTDLSLDEHVVTSAAGGE